MAQLVVPPKVASVVVLAEKYGLSLLFFFFAYRQLNLIPAHGALPGGHTTVSIGAAGMYFAILTRQILLFLFSFSIGLTLLFNRIPVKPPSCFKDIFIPLLATFFYLSYNFAGLAPMPLRENLLPDSFRAPVAVAALLLSIIGYLIAIWSVISLGRSFSLLISVRKIVCSGPYKYVHHPVYLGYFFLFLGLLLSNFSVFFILLTAIETSLMIYRARLEERALGQHSAAYREYIKRTGFLFPKLRRAVD